MKVMWSVFLVIVLALFLATAQTPISAEIATGRDWIGLYPADILDSNLAGLQQPHTWFYASSCTQTPNINNPLLSGTCTVNTTPIQSGSWIYRFFPNDKLYVADKTPYFWVTFDLVRATETCDAEEPIVELEWNPMVGVARFDVVRTGASSATIPVPGAGNAASFVDRSVANNATYTYRILAHSVGEVDAADALYSRQSLTVTTRPACQRPYVKTEGGDVHTNEGIDLPVLLP